MAAALSATAPARTRTQATTGERKLIMATTVALSGSATGTLSTGLSVQWVAHLLLRTGGNSHSRQEGVGRDNFYREYGDARCVVEWLSAGPGGIPA